MVGEVVYTFKSACDPKIGFGDTDIWIVEKLNPRQRDLVTITLQTIDIHTCYICHGTSVSAHYTCQMLL